jgi:hypothetical protein
LPEWSFFPCLFCWPMDSFLPPDCALFAFPCWSFSDWFLPESPWFVCFILDQFYKPTASNTVPSRTIYSYYVYF